MPLFRNKPIREVVFYTRAGCHLCDEALVTLRAHERRFRLKIEIVDIALSRELSEAYGEEIPVVFIDGRKRFFGHLDPVLLKRLLHMSPPNQNP